MNIIKGINKESTISVTGTVRERASKNAKQPTGEIEVVPEKIEILGRCIYNELPFEINRSREADETQRLKYRYLDLRNPEVKNNIILRCNVIAALRKAMLEHNFLEITTPILTASSPEGARDYLVPARKHPGKFYALPQAPQQFKQLLMTSGFDRYFQIAPCFRDEDARGDRSPGEFYQLDMEMAFASQEDVFSVIEDVLPPIFAKYGTYNVASSAPFKRIAYNDALEQFGTDKPDYRIDLRIQDITKLVAGSEFAPFAEGNTVKAIACSGCELTRKHIDKLCADVEVQAGSKPYWFKVEADGSFAGGVAKFMTPHHDAVVEALGLTPGTLIGIAAGKKPAAQKTAGVMRKMLGALVPGQIDPLTITAQQYDLVCNGIELSSGAVRNHDPEIMIEAFRLVRLGEEDVKKKFPAMYNAFCYGAPPHAGIAPGVDRMVMLLAGEDSIREIIPFPMNKNAQDILMGAPGTVTDKQLEELHIKVDIDE